MLTLSSCVNTRWLKSKEFLLYQQNITGNKEVNTDELEVLYKQLPNRKVPIIGSTLYLYFHLLGTYKILYYRTAVDHKTQLLFRAPYKFLSPYLSFFYNLNSRRLTNK